MSDTTEVHFRYAGEVRLDFPELDLAVILKGRLKAEPGLRLPVRAYMLKGDVRQLLHGKFQTNVALGHAYGAAIQSTTPYSPKFGTQAVEPLEIQEVRTLSKEAGGKDYLAMDYVKEETKGAGYKQDSRKLDYNLLMRDLAPQVEQIVKVLHWGQHTRQYPRNGFRTLPDAEGRFMAATQRHLAAMAKDALAKDSESGLPHAIHVIANQLMMLAALEGKEWGPGLSAPRSPEQTPGSALSALTQ